MVTGNKVDAAKADIVGGDDICSLRPLFDPDDRNLIVGSNRYLIYYDLSTREPSGRAYIPSSNLHSEEVIVSCEKCDSHLYISTNYGKIFLWDLQAKCWVKELYLPISDDESIVSCKLINKCQYIYTVLDNKSDQTRLFCSLSRSERERPKTRTLVGECSLGSQPTFDFGAYVDRHSDDSEQNDKDFYCLAFILKNNLIMQRIKSGEDGTSLIHQACADKEEFTCVRVHHTRPMVATGDSRGRIYLYTGCFKKPRVNRTNLHWHQLQVSDLCFSSTGNTLYSVGSESGCVVVWNLGSSNLGQKRVIARLGMPIRFINCGNNSNQLVIGFEDNEIQFLDTDDRSRRLRTLTKRTIDIFRRNDARALRSPFPKTNMTNLSSQHRKNRSTAAEIEEFIGLLWHSRTDSIVTNCRNGMLQFYSPRKRSRIDIIDILKKPIMSLESEHVIIPSDITRCALTLDGEWLACYETRKVEGLFPEVKLHIWQFYKPYGRWAWVQTIDRIHNTTDIVDLKFSPDGRFLVSVGDDGTFQILHRVILDSKIEDLSKAKQMYVKGFAGDVPKKLPVLAAFSQDSSVMAISLRNGSTLIWMIEDPYKLVYECQLNQVELSDDNKIINQMKNSSDFDVLGLHFGCHLEMEKVAPICEVRSTSIRVWNVLNPQDNARYSIFSMESPGTRNQIPRLTAAAFDECSRQGDINNYLAVATENNTVMIFKQELGHGDTELSPILIVDASLSFNRCANIIYTHMCFLEKPILDIDSECCSDRASVKLLGRLCLFNSQQELVSFTDKLTFERQKAVNSCNEINTLQESELREYFAKSTISYDEEVNKLRNNNHVSPASVTEKQRRIRNRQQMQKMLNNILSRIPAHNLPDMSILGPMLLNKLTNYD